MLKVMRLLPAFILAFAAAAFARNDVKTVNLDSALATADAKAKLGGEVKFYFGNQAHPKIEKTFGEFKTNKKTNAFNKSDLEACQWAFLSAMIVLKQRALKEGGNAVVDIKSNYQNNTTVSDTSFQCGCGSMVAGVALIGTVVKLEEGRAEAAPEAPAAKSAPEAAKKK